MDDNPEVIAAFHEWAMSEKHSGNPNHPLIRFTAEEAFKAGVAWADKRFAEARRNERIEASLRD